LSTPDHSHATGLLNGPLANLFEPPPGPDVDATSHDARATTPWATTPWATTPWAMTPWAMTPWHP